VAMTRARQSLTLIAPLRFHVTQQARDGDRHVYGARSRFVTERLLETFKQRWHGRAEATSQDAGAVSGRQLDVAARMREMWG
ncbi:MAG: ATP-dependent helicase, partial [Gammaproteobacteria bacterium]|nr:ATP-dependent helicase [Gammaproteobacteria bacterium]